MIIRMRIVIILLPLGKALQFRCLGGLHWFLKHVPPQEVLEGKKTFSRCSVTPLCVFRTCVSEAIERIDIAATYRFPA